MDILGCILACKARKRYKIEKSVEILPRTLAGVASTSFMLILLNTISYSVHYRIMRPHFMLHYCKFRVTFSVSLCSYVVQFFLLLQVFFKF